MVCEAVGEFVRLNMTYGYPDKKDSGHLFFWGDPVEWLLTRRVVSGVCSNYAQFTVALARACGVDAFQILCLARGVGQPVPNDLHAATGLRLCSGQMAYMDTTWARSFSRQRSNAPSPFEGLTDERPWKTDTHEIMPRFAATLNLFLVEHIHGPNGMGKDIGPVLTALPFEQVRSMDTGRYIATERLIQRWAFLR